MSAVQCLFMAHTSGWGSKGVGAAVWGTLGLTGLSRLPLGAPTAVPMERAVRNYPQEGFGHLLVGRLKSQPSAWARCLPLNPPQWLESRPQTFHISSTHLDAFAHWLL